MVVSTNKTSNHRFQYYYTHNTILCQVYVLVIIYRFVLVIIYRLKASVSPSRFVLSFLT